MGQIITIEQLRTTKRREEEVPIDRLGGVVRIQALSSEEFRHCQEQSKDEETGEQDNIRFQQLVCAFGLVEPFLNPDADQEQALKDVNFFDLSEQTQIGIAVIGITNRKASAAFRGPRKARPTSA